MCNQSVGLIQGVMEKEGLATVSISLLHEVTEKVRPPRALFVDFPLGYPLGRPHDPSLQLKVIRQAIQLLNHPDPLPLLADFK